MLFTTWKINDEEEMKLRLTASASVALERDLGANPISILQSIDENNLPTLEVLLKMIFHAATQFNHGLKQSDIYTAYDKFVDAGNSFSDLVPLVIDIFKSSGYLNSKEEDSNSKN